MTPEAIIENRRFQEALDKIRKEKGYDFATIVFYESNKPSSPIRWRYVSSNRNSRFKLIILRKGRGLIGTIMKTRKRVVIANAGLVLGPEEKINYSVLLSESLTAALAVLLWYKNRVYGVLLFGQRGGRPLPKTLDNGDIQCKSGIFNDDK